jgi:hypothetical protein
MIGRSISGEKDRINLNLGCRGQGSGDGHHPCGEFSLINETREVQVTPWNTQQHFAYFRFAPTGGIA